MSIPDPPRRGPVRRLYDWVLHWAETPYGPLALFLLAFAESSFFPIPPDPLLLALCLGAPSRSFRFAALTTVASVLGGVVGYAIGAVGWQALDQYFYVWVPGVTPEAFEQVRLFYDRWGFWAVFTAGLTVIPYKIFTISAGMFAMNLPGFVGASIVGRGLRFFLVGALVWRFGEPMGRFIDRHFERLTWVFAILLVGGFVVVSAFL